MAHRNRWFTWVYLFKMGGSFHGYVSHNQMVTMPNDIFVACKYPVTCGWKTGSPRLVAMLKMYFGAIEQCVVATHHSCSLWNCEAAGKKLTGLIQQKMECHD